MRIQHCYLLPLLFVLGACSKDNNSAAAPANGTAASPSTEAPLPAAVAEVPLNFPTYGFRIDSFDTPTRSMVQAMAMYMPLPPLPYTKPGDKIPLQMASYVNVQVVQPYPYTMAKYMADSLAEFDTRKFKKYNEKSPNPNEWIIEYGGLVQDVALHWYAHAILVNNKIVLATGTALENQWLDSADKIRPCVDSLALTTAAGSGLTMPNYGFQINPLETTLGSNPVVVQALVMAIPADRGGATVNVQIQPAPKNVTSMADYMKQSKEDMLKNTDAAFGIKGEETPKPNEWVLEYMGVVNNQAAHFIAHAIWANNRVYLATGSAPDTQWDQFGDRLKTCVNSFQVTSTTPFPPIVWPAEVTPAATADTAAPAASADTAAPTAGTAPAASTAAP